MNRPSTSLVLSRIGVIVAARRRLQQRLELVAVSTANSSASTSAHRRRPRPPADTSGTAAGTRAADDSGCRRHDQLHRRQPPHALGDPDVALTELGKFEQPVELTFAPD